MNSSLSLSSESQSKVISRSLRILTPFRGTCSYFEIITRFAPPPPPPFFPLSADKWILLEILLSQTFRRLIERSSVWTIMEKCIFGWLVSLKKKKKKKIVIVASFDSSETLYNVTRKFFSKEKFCHTLYNTVDNFVKLRWFRTTFSHPRDLRRIEGVLLPLHQPA